MIIHPYRVKVTDWEGRLVYYGPFPVPVELVTLTAEDFEEGRLYLLEVDTSRLSLN